MDSTLRISEMFYSIQGEGITTGIPAFFIRFSACNLLCGGLGTDEDKQLHDGATWRCDTIEVWKKGKMWYFPMIVEKLQLEYNFIGRLKRGAHIVFTGGEPMMQQERIVEFIQYLKKEFKITPFIEVETNGTIIPTGLMVLHVNQWNVSPKLSNSGMPVNKRYNREVISCISSLQRDKKSVMFKFVVSDEKDWNEIEEYFLDIIPRHQIVIMPAASTIEELHSRLPLLVELCKRETVRFCDRLHVEIWNQLTGV